MNNNNFIRGHRAKCNFYYDDFTVPQEIIDEVVKPFVVIGNENTKYVVPCVEKPIKLVFESEWQCEYNSDDYSTTFKRPLNDRERSELLNAINQGKIKLEEVK